MFDALPIDPKRLGLQRRTSTKRAATIALMKPRSTAKKGKMNAMASDE